MIAFWLVVILTASPHMSFGLVRSFDTKQECLDARKIAPKELDGKILCLPVVIGELKET